MFGCRGKSAVGDAAQGMLAAALRGMLAVALTGACIARADAAAPVVRPPPLNENPAPPQPVCLYLMEICPVPLPTYDGSGQLAHLDVAVLPDGFATHVFWLAATPYPNDNANLENPSLYTDTDHRWAVPPNIHNPLVPPPPAPAHNSDPDIIYDPVTATLRLYYRLTTGDGDRILVKTTSDGEHWSDPVTVAAAPGISIISPAVVRTPDAQWYMWSVNAVNGGCQAASTVLERRTSSNGLVWSPPEPVTIDQPGYVVWHLDVQYIPSLAEYWALIAAYPSGGGCATDDLLFARSTDGLHWQTYAAPAVARSDFAPFAGAVYRSTFTYEADVDATRMWLSGTVYRNGQWVWTTATTRWTQAELMGQIAAIRLGAPPAGGPTTWTTSSPKAAQSEFP